MRKCYCVQRPQPGEVFCIGIICPEGDQGKKFGRAAANRLWCCYLKYIFTLGLLPALLDFEFDF